VILTTKMTAGIRKIFYSDFCISWLFFYIFLFLKRFGHVWQQQVSCGGPEFFCVMLTTKTELCVSESFFLWFWYIYFTGVDWFWQNLTLNPKTSPTVRQLLKKIKTILNGQPRISNNTWGPCCSARPDALCKSQMMSLDQTRAVPTNRRNTRKGDLW